MTTLGPILRSVIVSGTFVAVLSPLLLPTPPHIGMAEVPPPDRRVASRPVGEFTGSYAAHPIPPQGALTRTVTVVPVFNHGPIYTTYPDTPMPGAELVADLPDTPLPPARAKPVQRLRKAAKLVSMADDKPGTPADPFNRFCSGRGQMSWMRINGAKRFCP